jgi:hypothetical protein
MRSRSFDTAPPPVPAGFRGDFRDAPRCVTAAIDRAL